MVRLAEISPYLRRASPSPRRTRSHATTPPIERALRQALGTSAELRRVSVRTSNGEVSFGSVPLGELRAFGRVLSSAKLPEPADAKAKTTG
jgi:hypothetical protein